MNEGDMYKRMSPMSTDNKQSLRLRLPSQLLGLSTVILVPARFIRFVNVCPVSLVLALNEMPVFTVFCR